MASSSGWYNILALKVYKMNKCSCLCSFANLLESSRKSDEFRAH